MTHDQQVLTTQWVMHGYSAIAPAIPSRIGYVIDGWSHSYLSITADIDIVASYIPINYTMTFIENGGSEVGDIIQGYETTIVPPSDPTRTGYTFAGWYNDSELTNAYVFSTMPLNGVTLYAKWTINQYTITYFTVTGDYDPLKGYSTLSRRDNDPSFFRI
ncbi:MAG: InlB B-repeat-containing protein [Bacillus subtilis]|nr:InlB B-repeat-containing protein [Bacillus subtilis]